jgi:para-nitrobenzyl esterase
MPVLVWIHGGGFTGGNSFSATTDGAKFAENGVVCVSIAYRLGVFGFLDVSPVLDASYVGSANNGLRDAMLALEWVRDNIAAFGGDPSQVTVGGQSAGAKLTDIMLGIPSAQRLFQRMISESGGAERVNALAAAQSVAVGFGTAWDKRSTLSVKTAAATDLIEAQAGFIESWPQHFPLRAEVDGDLIPRLPVETIANGSGRGKALLIGTNREESASFIGPHPLHDPTAADLGNTDLTRFDEVFRKYAALYPNLSAEQLRIRAVTAEEYWVPSIRTADAHVKGGGRAWMYELTLKDPVGKLQGYARHTLELGLVWSKPEVAAEAVLSTELHQAWVSFIKGQAPSATGLPVWPEYHSADRPTMMIDLNCRVETKPQEAELRLWDGFLA